MREAREFADERAFRPLLSMSNHKGCGFLKLSDCYPCLKGDEDLVQALKLVQQRKGPRF